MICISIMKRHIEATFGVSCRRGDAKILTIPLLDIRELAHDYEPYT